MVQKLSSSKGKVGAGKREEVRCDPQQIVAPDLYA